MVQILILKKLIILHFSDILLLVTYNCVLQLCMCVVAFLCISLNEFTMRMLADLELNLNAKIFI